MKRIAINLRPKLQASSLTVELEKYGAEVVSVPTLCLKGVNFKFNNDINWIALTSINAYHQVEDKNIFNNYKIAVIGDSTARILKENNVKVDFISDIANSESFAKSFSIFLKKNEKNSKVLFLKGSSASSLFGDILEENGISCEQEVVYSVEQEFVSELELENINKILNKKNIEISIFATSSFSLTSFCNLFDDSLSFLRECPVYVIGPKTAETARRLKFAKIIQAPEANMKSLAELFFQ